MRADAPAALGGAASPAAGTPPDPDRVPDRQAPIGVFDSGIGGLTVLHEIIETLPEKVYISFDIDGLDPKLCPNTGTPVPGGFELEQVFYLFRKLRDSGREIIGFDLNEVSTGSHAHGIDSIVGARALYKMCNLIL